MSSSVLGEQRIIGTGDGRVSVYCDGQSGSSPAVILIPAGGSTARPDQSVAHRETRQNLDPRRAKRILDDLCYAGRIENQQCKRAGFIPEVLMRNIGRHLAPTVEP